MNANVATSWNASNWMAPSRQGQTSLKKTIQAYRAISNRLNSKLDQLRQKRSELAGNAFIVVTETVAAPNAGRGSGATPTSPRPPPVADREVLELQLDSPTTTPPNPPDIQPAPRSRFEESNYHQDDLSTLAATATKILMESVEIRLAYVSEVITLLTNLYQENPKQRTPPEFALSRYDEWVQTNQRLFELNSKLYDLEKVKFDMQRREEGEQRVDLELKGEQTGEKSKSRLDTVERLNYYK